jgi:hypothetical protein
MAAACETRRCRSCIRASPPSILSAWFVDDIVPMPGSIGHAATNRLVDIAFARSETQCRTANNIDFERR